MHDHTYALPPSAQDQQCSYQHNNSITPSLVDLKQDILSGDSQEFTYEMLELNITAKEL